MCRTCAEGGRRCPLTEKSRESIKAASTRYYKRGKARLLIAQLSDHGIRAMGDGAMPPTYHAARSGSPLDLDEGREVELSEIAVPDKPRGALWTAPGRIDSEGAVKSAWTDYDATEGGSNRPSKALYVVRPQPGAVIVSIETPEDATALMNHYEAHDSRGERSFDWVAMKRDGIDGVYASPDAVQGNMHHTGQAFGNLYGWDASSVAWLSNENISVDEGTMEGGMYTVTHSEPEWGEGEGYQGWPEVSDDRMWEYETPQRPSLDGAWDRVPKKVRESKSAEGGLPADAKLPRDDQQSDDKESVRDVKVPKPKERTESVSQEQSILDAGKDGVEYLRGFLEKHEEKREDVS